MGIRWYVFEAKARAEQLACQHLEEQGFATLLPAFLRQRVVRHALVDYEEPVFPGYAFVAFDVQHAKWKPIANTRGVKRIFCHGDVPIPMPTRTEIDMLLRFAEGPLPDVEAVVEAIEVGMRVSIKDGPYAGMSGICRRSGKARVAVLLSMLGYRSDTIVLPVDSVELA